MLRLIWIGTHATGIGLQGVLLLYWLYWLNKEGALEYLESMTEEDR